MNDLLSQIELIQSSQTDAEIGVMESLIDSYDKSIMILENCDESTDLSAFDIFQEGEKWDKFKEDSKAPILGNKGESVAKRILMLLPRLIQKLIALIKKIFSGEKVQKKKMEKDIKDLEALAGGSSEITEAAVSDTADDLVQEASLQSNIENMTALVDLNTLIFRAGGLYITPQMRQLHTSINKCDTSKASQFGKLQENDPLLDECEKLKIQLRQIETRAESTAVSFEKDASKIEQDLTNRVVAQIVNYARNPNLHSIESRKQFLKKNTKDVKQIRDTIQDLYDKRRQIIGSIENMSEDMSKAFSEGFQFQSNNPHTGAAVEFVTVAYNVSKILNLIVASSYQLNQTVANSWNSMISAMKGIAPPSKSK